MAARFKPWLIGGGVAIVVAGGGGAVALARMHAFSSWPTITFNEDGGLHRCVGEPNQNKDVSTFAGDFGEWTLVSTCTEAVHVSLKNFSSEDCGGFDCPIRLADTTQHDPHNPEPCASGIDLPAASPAAPVTVQVGAYTIGGDCLESEYGVQIYDYEAWIKQADMTEIKTDPELEIDRSALQQLLRRISRRFRAIL